MYDQRFLVGGAVALFLYLIFVVVMGFVKKKGKYTLKRSINDLRPILTVIWVMYLLIGSMGVMPYIMNWTILQLSKSPTGSAAHLVMSAIPLVFILTIYSIVVSIIIKAYKPWFKYTDSELELLRKDSETFNRNVRRLLPWLRK